MDAFGKDLFAKPFPVKKAVAAACAAVLLITGAVILINRKPDTVVVSGDKTVAGALGPEDAVSADEKALLTELEQQLKDDGKMSRSPDSSYYCQLSGLHNSTGHDLHDMDAYAAFYDEDGVMLGNNNFYVKEWKNGDELTMRFFCNNSFHHASVKLEFSTDEERRLKTRYMDVTLDEGALSIEILPSASLPVTVTYSGYGSSVTYEISSMSYSASTYDSGAFVTIKLGGTCTLGDGSSGNLYYRLTDSDGAVCASGSIYNIPHLSTGERFENLSFTVSNLESGTYVLTLGGSPL